MSRDPKFQGPLGKARLVWKVADTLGWRWVATRLLIEAEKRAGVLERRTPVTTWDRWVVRGEPTVRLAPLHPSSAGRFLAQQGPDVEAALRDHLRQLQARQFRVFDSVCELTSWHEEPLSPASYPPDLHWAKIRELPGADLKVIWEPSRFGWVFDLARLHAVDPGTEAPEVFWELFEDWCGENQPNAGVNWQCGQEAALRLMAVLFGVFTFGEAHLDDARQRLLARFADVTARRILSHWRYARSQENNHVVSEAVGLITVALVFPELTVAARSKATGEKVLREACERLVFPDGGTSQYSLNYHRVFMENFIWALWLYRAFGERPPSELHGALRRSRDFLLAITETSDGSAGNWGSNDGAHLLPLASTRHLDVRPTLLMAGQLLDGGIPTWGGPAEEGVRWFWGDPVTYRKAAPEPHGVRATTFPYAGLSVLVNGRHRALIRGTEHQRFRPSQCDFGHVELWVDGRQVVFDPGTFSYKPKDDEPDYAESQWHNLPVPADKQQMTRLSRFLWADWPQCATSYDDGAQEFTIRLSFPSGQLPAISRRVRANPDGWLITDLVGSEGRSYLVTSAGPEPLGNTTAEQLPRFLLAAPATRYDRRPVAVVSQ